MKKYKVNKQLRFKAWFFKKIFPIEDESFKTYQRFIRLLYKGKKIRSLNSREEYIDDLRVCIYHTKKSNQLVPGFLWIHGGGYAIGLPEVDGFYYKNFIKTSPCVIVSPDYHLSIDSPFPSGVEDCYKALVWMKNNCETLGIDPNKIIVGGDSAGGGLAASVCLMARDKKEVKVGFQILIYPMLDASCNYPSSIDNDAPVWSSKTNKLAWKRYLNEDFNKNKTSKYASPLLEEDYHDLPRTYSYIGSMDVFLDETKKYISNLKDNNVNAKLDIYDGCFHAFDSLAKRSRISKLAISNLLKEYKEYCEDK